MYYENACVMCGPCARIRGHLWVWPNPESGVRVGPSDGAESVRSGQTCDFKSADDFFGLSPLREPARRYTHLSAQTPKSLYAILLALGWRWGAVGRSLEGHPPPNSKIQGPHRTRMIPMNRKSKKLRGTVVEVKTWG